MCNETSRHTIRYPDPLNASPEEIEAYEVRLKHVLDAEAAIREQEALEVGRKEGRQAAKEIMTRRLLATDMAIDDIVEVIKLDKKRILEMKREMES